MNKKKKSDKSFQRKVYSVIIISGIILLIASLIMNGDSLEDYANLMLGLGTGAISSLLVTILINVAADRRAAEERAIDRKIILNDIIYATKDAYCDIIYRLNEYIIFSKSDDKTMYKLYDDSKPFISFFDYLKNIDYSNLSADEQKELNKLLNLGSYRIDRLVSELKHIPKQSYYLERLLTSEELNGLSSNLFIDKYSEYASHIKEFWDYEIIDYQKCLTMFKLTLSCCCQIISTLEECRKRVEIEENAISDEIAEIYFREVYSQSEEYIEQEIEKAIAQQEYYDEHPELLEELEAQYEEWENETPTDRTIKEIECFFFGFCAYSFEDLLKKADKTDPKLLAFFKRKDIHKQIKKRKYRKSIIDICGQDFYDSLM